MLSERLDELKDKNSLPELEDFYFLLCNDLAVINQAWVDYLHLIQQSKLKSAEGTKTNAEAERKWQQTEEYLTERKFKLETQGIQKLLAGVKMRIESLRAEVNKQY